MVKRPPKHDPIEPVDPDVEDPLTDNYLALIAQLPPELLEQMDQQAKQLGLSLVQRLVHAEEEFIAQDEKPMSAWDAMPPEERAKIEAEVAAETDKIIADWKRRRDERKG